jgi:hypothetical protein
MLRRLFLLMLLGGAIGVPYLIATGSDWAKKVTATFTGSKEKPDAAPGDVTRDPTTATHQSPGGSPIPTPKLVGPPVYDLTEVIRFDATPAWIMSRWSRVLTVSSELKLQGFRVPLITGTTPDDLAGSLTYYFDETNKVQRIRLVGGTGNPNRLIAVVQRRYKMRREHSGDAHDVLYQAAWNGRPVSELRIRPAAVVEADAPQRRFQILLEINQPGGQLSRLARASHQEAALPRASAE